MSTQEEQESCSGETMNVQKGAEKPIRSSFESLRTNRVVIEYTRGRPFVLSLSKHINHIFRSPLVAIFFPFNLF